MNVAGFLLLLAGWGLVLASLALLPSGPGQAGFVLAALIVEFLGLALAIRAHRVPQGERDR